MEDSLDEKKRARKEGDDDDDDDDVKPKKHDSDDQQRRRRRGSESDDEDRQERKRRRHRDKKDDKDDRRKRKKRHKDEDDDGGERDDSSSEEERHRSRRSSSSKRRRKKKKKHTRDDDDDDESASESSSSSSSSSSSEEERRRKKRRKRDKKRKHHRKKTKKKKSRDDDSDNNEDGGTATATVAGAPSFGKYGILKASDMHRMQRTFQVWMAEIKGIPSFTGSKFELQKYFDEYREDFNTATLPHIKYYDYDKWEMEEYQKQKAVDDHKASRSQVLTDERKHQELMKQRAAAKQQAELELVRSTMSAEKVQEMKRQAELRAEMQTAFKMGDTKTYERLKERLAADEK